MVGWMLDKVKSAVRDFLKGVLLSVAKRVLAEKLLEGLLVSAGKYKKRLDVVILFEKRKVLFGLEGEALEVYEVPPDVMGAVVMKEYEALWEMARHLPKKRVKEEGGWRRVWLRVRKRGWRWWKGVCVWSIWRVYRY